jgi:Protein of unknown function (DUF2442)
MNPRVKNVKAIDNYILEIEFANNETKLFDVSPYLNYPIYESLKDVVFFSTARVSLGTVVWNDDIDFCPDTLFLESKVAEIENQF